MNNHKPRVRTITYISIKFFYNNDGIAEFRFAKLDYYKKKTTTTKKKKAKKKKYKKKSETALYNKL